MTKLKIKVTKDILEKSKNCGEKSHDDSDYDEEKHGKGSNCAIALAIRDIFPKAAVGRTAIFPFFFPRKVIVPQPHINLPLEATFFIDCFDAQTSEARVSMPELEFEIEIPDHIIETIDIQEIKESLINHPTLELV